MSVTHDSCHADIHRHRHTQRLYGVSDWAGHTEHCVPGSYRVSRPARQTLAGDISHTNSFTHTQTHAYMHVYTYTCAHTHTHTSNMLKKARDYKLMKVRILPSDQ